MGQFALPPFNAEAIPGATVGATVNLYLPSFDG